MENYSVLKKTKEKNKDTKKFIASERTYFIIKKFTQIQTAHSNCEPLFPGHVSHYLYLIIGNAFFIINNAPFPFFHSCY